MPVPADITDLSVVPAENSPAGTEAAFPNLDNYLRTAFAFIAQLQAEIDALAVAAGYAPLAGAQFTGSIGTTPVVLTDGATITPDASMSNSFRVTLGGNRVLANPTGLKDGGTYHFLIVQDGTGGRTLTYGTFFKWSGGVAPSLSAAAGSVDLITGHYNATLGVLACTFVGSLL
jgi:hypothetical protein